MIGGGITNTLDLGGGQKIQDYLAGAGVSNQGPGGGTLYTAGGGTAAGGGTIPQGIAVHNIDDQGNITGQTGFGRVVAQYGNIKDLNSFSPELQAAIQSYQNPKPQNYMSNLLQQAQQQGQPAPGVAAGIAGMIPAMGETRPALYDPRQRAIDEGYQPGSGFMYEGKFYESGNPGRVSMDMAPLDSLFANNPAAREAFKESGMKLVMNPNPNPQAGQQLLGPDGKPMQPFTGDASPVGGPAIDFNEPITPKGPTASTGQEFVFQKMFEDAGINPFGPQEGVMPELDNIGLITNAPGYNPFGPTDVPLFGEQEQQPGGGQAITNPSDSFGIGSNPIMDNPIAPMPNMPTAPNTQPGHSHDDLLSGIGKLFEQYFPQQGSQQINQPSPMFDAAGNSVPDGQTQSSQVFGNMITPNFGGGY